MIQDFTFFFFANITASYVNRGKEDKKQIKQRKRSEWSTRSFQAYILRHSLGVSKTYLIVNARKNEKFKT